MRLWAPLAAILLSAAAAAQPRPLTPDAIELLEASREISYLAKFFAAPNPNEISAGYRAFNAAIQTFSSLAPAEDVEIALRRVQAVYREFKTPEPAALQFAAVDADQRRNPRLTVALTSSLLAVFHSTANRVAAGTKFNPIRDNPALYGAVQAPAAGIDFLRNVKWLIDHAVLTREDFYTPENMQRFFGIDAVPMRSATGAIGVDKATKPEREDASRCEYSFGRGESSGTPTASFRVHCRYGKPTMPTFDEVEAVFGRGWRDGLIVFGPSPHGGPAPARAKHGNQVMVYDFSKLRLTRMVIGFDRDGNFDYLLVEVGEP